MQSRTYFGQACLMRLVWRECCFRGHQIRSVKTALVKTVSLHETSLQTPLVKTSSPRENTLAHTWSHVSSKDSALRVSPRGTVGDINLRLRVVSGLRLWALLVGCLFPFPGRDFRGPPRAPGNQSEFRPGPGPGPRGTSRARRKRTRMYFTEVWKFPDVPKSRTLQCCFGCAGPNFCGQEPRACKVQSLPSHRCKSILL
jgi:hypothetical protein